VHFPFCLRKCAYCDFNSHVPAGGEPALYLTALAHRNPPLGRARWAPAPWPPSTFGGGTPTVLPPRTSPASWTSSRFLTPHPPMPKSPARPIRAPWTRPNLRRWRGRCGAAEPGGCSPSASRSCGCWGGSTRRRGARGRARGAGGGFDNVSLDLIPACRARPLAEWDKASTRPWRWTWSHLSCYGCPYL